MVKYFAIFAVIASPALAEAPIDRSYCEALWWQRNQIFDNAGHCFSSPLGRAMFDNSDCVSGDTVLNARDAAFVREIRAEERTLGCAVDTSSPTPLDIPDLAGARALPYFTPGSMPSGCIGWIGPAFALHQEPAASAPVIGRVEPGDDIAVTVDIQGPDGTWFYYFKWVDNALRFGGWADRDLDWSLCESNAG